MPLTRRGFLGAVAAFAGDARAQGLSLQAAALANGGLGYAGASPGPVLRAKAGAPIRVTLANRLAAPTALRLPGARLDDLAPLAPGATRDYVAAPPSGFDLYFPYGPPEAATQLGAGLFGAVVVEEPDAPRVDLDAVVIFSGPSAETLRVNGADAPLRLSAPPGGRVRLRLANACPELLLGFRAGDPTARLGAIDGRSCPAFTPRGGEFAMCPGARFEWIIDLKRPFELFARDGRPVLRIATTGEPASPRDFAGFPVDPRLPLEIALESARQIKLALSGSKAKGYALGGAGSSGKPLFRAARGAPVALTLVNDTDDAQTLRLEGHCARILHALDDGWDPYWRDCLFVAPGHTLHAAFVAAAPGRWLLASASPERGARGLAGWFAVA